MNLYDTKTIACKICGKCIGEVDYDCEIIKPSCGKCAHTLPEENIILGATSVLQANSIPY
jgi:hypothetical protein